MRFKLNKSPNGSQVTMVNRGGIRLLPDAEGVFDTELYRDSVSVDSGSLAITDLRYTTTISEEQVASAKKEVEDLVIYWESTGLAEILDKPKAKKSAE